MKIETKKFLAREFILLFSLSLFLVVSWAIVLSYEYYHSDKLYNINTSYSRVEAEIKETHYNYEVTDDKNNPLPIPPSKKSIQELDKIRLSKENILSKVLLAKEARSNFWVLIISVLVIAYPFRLLIYCLRKSIQILKEPNCLTLNKQE